MFHEQGCEAHKQKPKPITDLKVVRRTKIAVTTIYSGMEMVRGICGLFRSACWNNVSMHVLHSDKWKGLGQKIEMMSSFLDYLAEESKASGTRWIVMFVDGYDVLLQVDSEEIKRRYLESGHSILISSETTCFPFGMPMCNLNLNVCGLFEQAERRFPNSGGLIGEASALRRLVSELKQLPSDLLWHWPGTDQGLMGQIYLSHRLKGFGIDSNSEFWATSSAERLVRMHDTQKREVFTLAEHGNSKRPPASLHFNGAGTECFRALESAAWYNKEDKSRGEEAGSGSCPRSGASTLVYEYDILTSKIGKPQSVNDFYESRCKDIKCNCDHCECSANGVKTLDQCVG